MTSTSLKNRASTLEYSEWMHGLFNAPGDNSKCQDCGGIGLVPEGCCSGRECGCMGLPVDYRGCHCGADQPTDEQIRRWSDRAGGFTSFKSISNMIRRQ